jgi:hypothetical protein
MKYAIYTSKNYGHYIILKNNAINKKNVKDKSHDFFIFRYIYIYEDDIDYTNKCILDLIKTNFTIENNKNCNVFLADEYELETKFTKLKEINSLSNFYKKYPELFI